MANEVKLLAGLQTTELDKDLIASDGSIMAPAGTCIVIIPQTLASAVIIPQEDNKTLSTVWSTISRTGHEHTDYQTALAGYQETLTTWTTRTTALETKLAELTDWAKSNGYEPSE